MSGYKPGATERQDMTDGDDTVQLWLVERDYNDKGLVTLVYATPDGEQCLQSNRSSQMLTRKGVTAATEADPEKLQPVEDADRQERYASEVQRMTEKHAPDDEV